MRWALTAVLVVIASTAQAAELPPHTLVRLDYEAHDPDCPSPQFLEDVIRARISYEPFAPGAMTRLRITVARAGRLYTGHAELRDQAGALVYRRDLGPRSDCLSVVEGLGFVVSVKLDAGGPEAAKAPLPEPSPAPPPSPPPPDEARPTPPAEQTVHLRLGASVALGLGVAPRPAAGLAMDVGFRWRAFSFAMEGRDYPPAQGPADAAGIRLRTWQRAGSAVPCGHLDWLFGCGVVQVGAFTATSDAQTPVTTTVLHFATGVRAGVEWQAWEHVALRASGDVLFVPWRPTVRIDAQPALTLPVISGAFGAGVVASF